MKKSSFLKISGMALAIATISSGTYAAQLEEIIVTAQKRAESLQDVALSITALDGAKIEAAGINSFGDLSAYVPNLSITENAVNTIIGMRGIGIGANQSFEQSVGVYVDGVHYGKSRQIRTGLFDLQQVEVLRGPQGILFGKNTLAGAINVTSASAKVGEEFNGKVALNRESFDGQTIEGHLAGSLSDTVAVRLAYKDRSDEGYQKNSMVPGTTFVGEATPGALTPEYPKTEETMARLSVNWTPNDSTKVELKHAESEHKRTGGSGVVTTFSAGLAPNIPASNFLMYGTMGAVYPQLAGLVASGAKDGYRDGISLGGCALAASVGKSHDTCSGGSEMPEGTDTSTKDTSLGITIDLANGYTFSSVTGLNSYEYEDGMDADWLPVRFIGRSDISNYDHSSQEFRIASPAEDKFSFVAGAYYDKQEQEIDRLVVVDGTFGIPETMPYILANASGLGLNTFLAFSPAQIAGAGLPAAYYGIEGVTKFEQVGRISNWSQDTESWAVFFQGKYRLSDQLTLTAGVRYTEEDKTSHAETQVTTSSTGLTTPNASPLLAALMAASFDTYEHEFDEKRSTNQLMPAVTLEWEPSEDSMFYASYSEGFKSGGFNSVDDQNPAFAANGAILRTTPGLGFEYDDETAGSFEIGGKHTLLDGAMNLNWAVFDSTYEDQQVSTFVGLGFVVTNAASTDITGLEVDLKWQATDNLLLSAGLAVMEGKYGQYPGAGCTAAQAAGLLGLGTLTANDGKNHSYDGCTATFKGDGSQNPSGTQNLAGEQVGTDYNGSLSADYMMPLSQGVVWFAGVDVNFTAGYYMAGDQDPIDYHEGFEKINIRTGLRGENWDLMLYGKNVTDEITASGAADVPLAAGSHFQYTMPGRVWGARLSYNF
ncbi:MAG: TonB-dependent receptor [Porticoccaceae bacterium]